jgi:hypothetical protein
MTNTVCSLVPFSSYRTLFSRSEVRSEAQPPAPMTKTKLRVKPGLSRRGAKRPAGVVGITRLFALPDSESTILKTRILASFSSPFREPRDSPFDCRQNRHLKRAFYRQPEDCRDRGFSVPATGLSGLQNPLNTQEKLSSKKYAREVAFSWLT